MLIKKLRADIAQDIYLDYNACTPVLPEVLSEMTPFFDECFYNITNPYSLEINQFIEGLRADILKALGGQQGDIVFYSGATEAINAIIKGVALKSVFNGESDKNIIVSAIEHDAALVCAQNLEKLGIKPIICPVNENGMVILEKLQKLINQNTLLVSIMHVNNETGVIQPMKEISKICQEKNILFHSDGVLAVGRVDISNVANHVDFYTIAANKFYGPKGISCNYIKNANTLARLTCGSGQENNLRAGTQNVPNIVGLATALSITLSDQTKVNAKEKVLRDKLKAGILEIFPDVKINGSGNIIANTLNVSFKNLDRHKVLEALINSRILANVGATYLDEKSSHVIKAMYTSPDYASGSIRFSVGRNSTEDHINKAITALQENILPLY
ncbi:MAG: cysteine desulfurase [Alphaproteobacteria bacterium]|jgi:cysteine desulfurase|nr:cysteine desulfurase [Alphaproteobacteria bacterium]